MKLIWNKQRTIILAVVIFITLLYAAIGEYTTAIGGVVMVGLMALFAHQEWKEDQERKKL